jgi:cupin fold WbuC family metalloprotein
VKILARSLLDELAAQAALSPRGRAHHTIHTTPQDRVQRFIVAARADSYFRPHRHAARSELALVVRGRFDVLTFDALGRVLARYPVGDGTPGMAYETPRGTWHTLVPGTEGGAFLEIKEGPYDPTTAAEFAAWAPAEGAAAVSAFLVWLRRAAPGDVPPAQDSGAGG